MPCWHSYIVLWGVVLDWAVCLLVTALVNTFSCFCKDLKCESPGSPGSQTIVKNKT